MSTARQRRRARIEAAALQAGLFRSEETVPLPGEPSKVNPLLRVFGAGPAGAICRDCVHLHAIRYANTYWKCDLRANTNGAATDHRVRWPACGKFEAREQELQPMK